MAKARVETKPKVIKKEIEGLDINEVGWTVNDLRKAVIENREKINELIKENK